MKRILLITMILLTCMIVFAQEEVTTPTQLANCATCTSKVFSRTFYTEMFGPSIGFAANWDSRFNSNERSGFGYRVGIGFSYDVVGDDPSGKNFLVFPVGLNYVFVAPNDTEAFEVGLGMTFLTRNIELLSFDKSDEASHMYAFLSFMYRLMPRNGGFSYRVGFTPRISLNGSIMPWFSTSLGYVF